MLIDYNTKSNHEKYLYPIEIYTSVYKYKYKYINTEV